MSENDKAWRRFFEQTDTLAEIARAGYATVTADALKAHGGRETQT